MNQSHYPSLELCKKLTKIGFPDTEKDIELGVQEKPMFLVMPSIMEILDVMPKFVTTYKKSDGTYQVRITPGKKNFIGTLPNALAEMILYLHENNYISFSK